MILSDYLRQLQHWPHVSQSEVMIWSQIGGITKPMPQTTSFRHCHWMTSSADGSPDSDEDGTTLLPRVGCYYDISLAAVSRRKISRCFVIFLSDFFNHLCNAPLPCLDSLVSSATLQNDSLSAVMVDIFKSPSKTHANRPPRHMAGFARRRGPTAVKPHSL
jgi:hypothetical protein